MSLSLKRGNTRQFTMTFTKTGAPLDLSTVASIALVLQFPSAPGGVAAQRLAFAVGTGITINSPASAGIATWTLPSSATSVLPNVDVVGRYEVTVTDGGGNVTTTETGTLEVVPTI